MVATTPECTYRYTGNTHTLHLKLGNWCYFYWSRFLILSIRQLINYLFPDRVLLYIDSTGWPGTHYADQTSLKITKICLPSIPFSLSPGNEQVIFLTRKKENPLILYNSHLQGLSNIFKTKRDYADGSILHSKLFCQVLLNYRPKRSFSLHFP